MRTGFLILGLCLLNACGSTKGVTVRIDGLKKITELQKNVNKNVTIVIEGYDKRIRDLLQRIHEKELLSKLRTDMDEKNRISYTHFIKVYSEWKKVRENTVKSLNSLKEKALKTKDDLVKIQFITNALEQLAKKEAEAGEISMADFSAAMKAINDASRSLNAEEEESARFQDLVKSLPGG